MDAETRFIEHISRLRRLFITKLVTRILLHTLLLALILNFVAISMYKFNVFPWSGYSIPGLLVLFAFAFSLFMALLHKQKHFMDELIDIDIRLELDERLSTAYEYSQHDQRSEIGALLIEEVSHLLSSIDKKRIYPPKLSVIHLLIPVFAGAIIALFTLDFLPIISKQGQATRERFKQIGAHLQELSERTLSDIKSEGIESEEEIVQQTKALADSLQEPSKSKEDLVSEMEAVLNDIRAERRQITGLLESQIMDQDISDVPGVSPSETDEILTSDQLTQLMEQLEKMMEQLEQQGFDERVQGNIPRTLLSLNRTLQLEQSLQEAMEDMRTDGRSDNTLTDDEIRLFVEEPGQETRELGEVYSGEGKSSPSDEKTDLLLRESDEENAKQVPKASETLMLLEEISELLISPGGHPLEDLSDMSEEDELAQGGGLSAPPDRKQERDGQEEFDSGQEDQFSSIAGREKGEYTLTAPNELLSSQRLAIQDKISEGPAERYHKIVRSVATIGKAELEIEDVIASFQKEVEEILKKEEIPVKYREYIRNYFISIGVRKGRVTYDSTK